VSCARKRACSWRDFRSTIAGCCGDCAIASGGLSTLSAMHPLLAAIRFSSQIVLLPETVPSPRAPPPADIALGWRADVCARAIADSSWMSHGGAMQRENSAATAFLRHRGHRFGKNPWPAQGGHSHEKPTLIRIVKRQRRPIRSGKGLHHDRRRVRRSGRRLFI